MTDVIEKMAKAAAEQTAGQQSYQDIAQVMSRVLIEGMREWRAKGEDELGIPGENLAAFSDVLQDYAKSEGIE